MNRLIESVMPGAAGSTLFASLVEGAIKGTTVLAIAALLAFVLQRTSAARRHLIWACALGMLALMPVLALILPAWRIDAPAVAWMAPIESSPGIAGATPSIDDARREAEPSTVGSGVPEQAPDAGVAPAAPTTSPVKTKAAEEVAPAPIDVRTLAVLSPRS
jgi:hypothetical protein